MKMPDLGRAFLRGYMSTVKIGHFKFVKVSIFS